MWRSTGDLIIWVSAVVMAVTAICRVIWVVVRAAARKFSIEVREIVKEELEPFRQELTTNGGSSVKDIAISTNRSVEEMRRQLEDIAVFKRQPPEDVQGVPI